MTINTMHFIESMLGRPICMLLSIMHRVYCVFNKERKPVVVRKILVMKFFGKGSILYATPMLKTLRDAYPSARIDFLTFEVNRDLVRRFSLMDNILTLRTASFAGFSIDVFRILAAMQRTKYDVTIDLEFFAKFSTILTFLSGGPIRLGYYLRHLWRGDLLTHNVYFNPHHHITSVFAAMLEPLGIERPSELLPLRPHISPSEFERASDILSHFGITSPFIVMNVNAGPLSLERRWPAEYWRELTNFFLDRTSCTLAFIGDPEERDHVRTVLDALQPCKRIVDLAGATGLGELLALLQRSALVISNDSGPLHLAASLGRPTVGLFGPETPVLYGPVWEHSLVLFDGIYCSPCINVYNAKRADCGGEAICLRRLTPALVFDNIKYNFPRIFTSPEPVAKVLG